MTTSNTSYDSLPLIPYRQTAYNIIYKIYHKLLMVLQFEETVHMQTS